jgi:hypothetical protein
MVADLSDPPAGLPPLAGRGPDHPPPPPRPGNRGTAVAATGSVPLPADSAPAAETKDGRAQLRTLLAEAAAAPALRAPDAKPAPAASGTTVVAAGFSSSPLGDLTTGRFTGPAVKPVAVVR